MAEIAAVFHWPPSALEALSYEDLVSWRNKAVSIWNRMNVAPKG